MASTGDPKELKGLARSIDALFTDEGMAPHTEDVVREEIVWEEVPAEARPGPNAEDANPDELREALDAFLSADPMDRDGLARALRESAAALREAHDLDAIAVAVERLAREAGDPPDEACIAMAQALLWPGVASRFVGRLSVEREEEKRADLVGLCVRLGPDMAVALSEELSETTERSARRVFVNTIVAMGEVAMPVVEGMMEDGRWYVVRNGVTILGEVGGERAVELIMSALAHTDGRVRREALHALAKVGGEDAGVLVVGMLEDTDPEVRLAAAVAAGALRVERALKPLLLLLEGEKDLSHVVGFVQALGQLGDPGAVHAIEKRAVGGILSRPPTEVRITAYRALHKIATPHAKSLLVQAADDKDAAVKTEVRRLLRMR